MICYQCQGTGWHAQHPGWPCPLCMGQRHLHCCEGDQEQPEPSRPNTVVVPLDDSLRNQVERVRAQRVGGGRQSRWRSAGAAQLPR